jgi:hypothetical protein
MTGGPGTLRIVSNFDSSHSVSYMSGLPHLPTCASIDRAIIGRAVLRLAGPFGRTRSHEHESTRPYVGTRHRHQLRIFRARHRRFRDVTLTATLRHPVCAAAQPAHPCAVVRRMRPTLTDSVRCYFLWQVPLKPGDDRQLPFYRAVFLAATPPSRLPVSLFKPT